MTTGILNWAPGDPVPPEMLKPMAAVEQARRALTLLSDLDTALGTNPPQAVRIPLAALRRQVGDLWRLLLAQQQTGPAAHV